MQPNIFQRRQDTIFFILAGLFLGSLGMLNIIGITRFIDLSFTVFSVNIPMVVAVGVLPYPITFLCTDLISELYGKRKATELVWVGLLVNIWIVFILWLGSILPGFEALDPETGKLVKDNADRLPLYFEIKERAFGAVTASMVAYLTAQFCDVHLFHFWKNLTKGKHLWLRNNGSTLISQFIDTIAVILITHYYNEALPLDESKPLIGQLLLFIYSGYIFKILVALLDTIPFYILVRYLRTYLNIPANQETPS